MYIPIITSFNLFGDYVIDSNIISAYVHNNSIIFRSNSRRVCIGKRHKQNYYFVRGSNYTNIILIYKYIMYTNNKAKNYIRA